MWTKNTVMLNTTLFSVVPLLLFLGTMSVDLNPTEPPEIIEIPVVIKKGYGPFNPGMGTFDTNPAKPGNPWSKYRKTLQGLPDHVVDPVSGYVWFDPMQFVFQKYRSGEMEKERFLDLAISWSIDTTSETLTEKPVRSFINYMTWKQGDTTWVVRFDRDYDGRVDDEEDHYIDELSTSAFANGADGLLEDTLSFTYDYVRGGEIKQAQLPFYVGYLSAFGAVLRSIPMYAVAEFGDQVISVDFGFSSIRYGENATLTLAEEYNREMAKFENDQYVMIDGYYYKNLGLDYEKQVLRLMKMPGDSMLYSTQTGFYAIPFEGFEFTTEEKIALENYKGKYLYLDFWGSWCGPCVQELPNLKQTYENLDTTKIDVLGVARDNEQSLRNSIEKYQITWKQILSNNDNQIVEKYSINSYPTTLLIDPEGKIVATDLRGESLADTLSHYIRNY